MRFSIKEYQCEHIKLAKNYPNASPLGVFVPVLDSYSCSDSIRQELSKIMESLPSNTSSDIGGLSVGTAQSFVVFGPTTTSNPLGFCHVKVNKKVKGGYVCSGKECSGNAAKEKVFSVRSCCLHLHLLLASLRQSTHLALSNSVLSSTASCKTSASSSLSVPQQSPSLSSAIQHCLGKETNHPGQQSNDAYLITELNAFSQVDVKMKTCSSKDCLAIHRPFPVDIGIIFNTCTL